MARKMSSLAVLALLLSAGCAAMTPSNHNRSAPEGPGLVTLLEAERRKDAPAGQSANPTGGSTEPTSGDRAVDTPPPGGAKPGDGSPTLTESLHSALQQVKEQRTRIRKLSEATAELKNEVARKEQKIEQLNSQLQTRTARVKKLEKAVDQWKQDVLSYRDEMRQAEKAEMQALTQIISLLKSFEQEQEGEATGGSQ